MAAVESGAGVDYLRPRTKTEAAISGATVIDVPVAETLQGIIGGKYPFHPELDVVA
jgi:hypothetical protein